MIEKLYSIYKHSTGVCTDTRSIYPGSIFFALKGGNFNGNLFAKEALEKGCSCAIVDEDLESLRDEPRILKVENVLQTLQQLAKHHRSKLKIPVLALTGSNGKTTTKELISSVLGTTYKTHATSGNLNNHIGVPLTVLSIREEHEIAVIEMGANHREEIKRLCGIAAPEYGLITNIGLAHLEGFGGEEGVFLGKKELFDYLQENQGKLFVNLDDQKIVKAAAESVNITYGHHPDSFYQGSPTLHKGLLRVNWSRKNLDQQFNVQTKLTGIYNFSNVMAAIAVGRFFGVSDRRINRAIKEYTPKNNRSQLEKTNNGNILILDHYNANPSSMGAALDNLEAFEHPSKMAILGDMLEGGEDTIPQHQKVLDRFQDSDTKYIVVIGPVFSSCTIPPGVKHYENTDEARKALEKDIPKKSLILVKGSRGIRLEKLIDLL